MKILESVYLWLGCGLLTLILILAIVVKFHEKAKTQLVRHNVIFEDSLFNFGTVLQDEKIRHEFRLLNNSSNEVLIAGLRTTCSCTVTESNLLGSKIKPQGAIDIPIIYDTGNRDGDVSSSVIVLIRLKGSESELEATMHGSISPDFMIAPDFIDFGGVKPGEDVTRSVFFRPKALKTVIIKKPDATNYTFTVSLNDERTGYAQALITFHAPPFARRQTLSDLLQFSTSSERVPIAKVYVRGEVVPVVEIIPDVLVLSTNETLKDVEFTIHTIQRSRVVNITGNISGDAGSQFPIGDKINTNAFDSTHNITLSSVLLKNLQQMTFELEVQNGTNHTETQFVSVPIKSL